MSRGIGLGPNVLEALEERGIRSTGYRWVYNVGIERDEFPAHKDLEGQFFGLDEIPVESSSWPYALEPDDHNGCECDLLDVLRGPDGRFARLELEDE